MKSSDDDAITIGQLAQRFALPTHVLRYWESIGLLAPTRNAAGQRRYQPADLYRVAVILGAKTAGLSLEQISEVLNADQRHRNQLLSQHRDDLLARIAGLQTSLELIDGVLTCDHTNLPECPHFQEFITARIEIA